MPRLLKVVCAPNALKGTLSAADAAVAIAEGVRSAVPLAEVVELPIADGGDGTQQVLVASLGGEQRMVRTTDPLGRTIAASYGVIEQGQLAVIDVASASGLARLRANEQNPWCASSRGTGELLLSALESGASRVVVGAGGSATVDGGTGLLSALGARFLDGQGRPIESGGAGLATLSTIDFSRVLARLRGVRTWVACDVDCPLLGAGGAARRFAPQKGASPRVVEELEAGIERLAQLLERTTGRDVRNLPYGGAAGGIAASLFAVLDAELVSGVDWVLDAVAFDDRARDADLVITAEGCLDAGSFCNKGPVGVARRAARHGVPTLALVGSISSDIGGIPSPFSEITVFGDASFDVLVARRESARWLARASGEALNRWLARPSRHALPPDSAREET